MYSSAMTSVPTIRRGAIDPSRTVPPLTTSAAATGTLSPPSINSAFDQLKTEFENAIQHAHVAEQAKLEMERRIQTQVAEMAHMQQILTALEDTHRRICREHDHEVARLRRDVEARHNPTSARATEQPSMMPSSTKRLRTTASEGGSVSKSAREDDTSVTMVNAVATTATASLRPQIASVVSSEHSKSFQTAKTTRMTAPQPDLRQPKQVKAHHISSPPSSTSSLQHLETAKLNEQYQARPKTSSTRSTQDDGSSRPVARVAPTSTHPPHQESTKQPLSPRSVAPQCEISASNKSPNGGPDKPSSSNSTASAVLSWKCVYPSKSVLPSTTFGQEPRRPGAELHHTMDLQSAVCTVRFSRDGAMVAVGCLKSAQVFNVKTGKRTFVVSHPTPAESDAADQAANTPEEDDGHVRAVCFSPDSTKLIVGMPWNTIRTWDLASETQDSMVMTGHKNGIYALDCVGGIVVSGSGDHTVRLWDSRSGQCKRVFGSGSDGASGKDDSHSNGPLDGVTSVALSPDGGRLLASGSLDKVVRIYDTETGQLLDRFEGHSDSVYSVAFSPDGRQLVSGSFDRTIMLWNVGGGAQVPSTRPRMVFQGHRELVLSVAYTPDGRYLMSGSKDRTVRFWDPRSTCSELTLTGHRNSVIGVAASSVSPYFATASGDGVAALWEYRCETL